MTPQKLIVFTDGGARGNPGPAATGFVIKDETGNLIHEHGQTIGEATNNTAEYQAVINALIWIIKQAKIKAGTNCSFHLDSKLVVNQLNNNFKVKKPHLRLLLTKVRQLETESQLATTYKYVPRDQNSRADFLLNQALDSAS